MQSEQCCSQKHWADDLQTGQTRPNQLQSIKIIRAKNQNANKRSKAWHHRKNVLDARLSVCVIYRGVFDWDQVCVIRSLVTLSEEMAVAFGKWSPAIMGGYDEPWEVEL